MKNKTQKNIPLDWKEAKLVDIGKFSKGSGISKSELSDKGYNAVRYGEIYTRHDICIKKIHSFISDDIIRNAKKIKYGDILFAGSGETIDEIGKSATYLKKDDCYAGGDIIIFSPKKQSSLFLAFLLNSGTTRKNLRKLGQGQSVVHIYKKDLEKLNILLPPLPEQKAIVAILETWDKYLKKLSKKIKIKKNIKKGLMQRLLSGDVRLDGFRREWESVKLGDVCDLYQPKTISSKVISKIGKYKVFGANGTIGFYDKYNHKNSEVLITCRGATCGTINFSSKKSWVTGNAMVATPKNNKIDKMYLYYLLNLTNLNNIITGLAQPQITRKDLSPFKLIIPKLNEQTAIAKILTTADKEIETLEKKKNNIEEQKKFLLNNLVTGRIRVLK
ncbi:restriction endonuclease subunit S [Candidatus Parcubacteria bacterium]|nr:restriction endonuclease subunit S [Candidatus Parcubacteria bacterium]